MLFPKRQRLLTAVFRASRSFRTAPSTLHQASHARARRVTAAVRRGRPCGGEPAARGRFRSAVGFGKAAAFWIAGAAGPGALPRGHRPGFRATPAGWREWQEMVICPRVPVSHVTPRTRVVASMTAVRCRGGPTWRVHTVSLSVGTQVLGLHLDRAGGFT